MIETEIEIAPYIEESCIAFLDTTDRKEALQTLVDLAGPSLQDAEIFFQDVVQRETIVSTGIGMGIALPHARTNQLDDFLVLLGISQGRGIEWNAIDGLDVHLIFLIGGPQDAPKEYLTFLSRLTALLKEEEFRSRILTAKDAQTVVNIFHSC